MDSSQKVGKRIREYRQKAHISQEDLAESVGLSTTSVSNIERGLHYPSMEHFIKIANIIGVSADLLLFDVIRFSQVAKESEISARLGKVPVDRKCEIYAVIEVLLNDH